MMDRAARLVSNVLNPFLVTFVVIVLLAVEATSDAAGAVKWAATALALSVLPVFLVVLYLVRRHRLESIFVKHRRQRTGVYALASVLGAIGCLILWRLDAPPLLLTTFIAGLAAVIIFMVINLYWKISAHTAFVTGAAAVLTIVYGAAGALTLILVPLIGWARLRLSVHSWTQVAAAVVLVGGITAGIFWAFGMI
jgi:membrane-associated phospholipid phosphatase